MTTGTPGFNGDRLRESREAIGITQTSLADLTGISRQAISQYERGDTTPNPLMLDRLSSVLQIPVEYFLLGEIPGAAYGEPGPVFFRSRQAELKTARQRARIRQRWLVGLVDALEIYVDLPQPDLPDFGFPSKPELISQDMVEYAARTLRVHWSLGDGPIDNLTWLLENKGVIVGGDEALDGRLEAYSSWYGKLPVITMGDEDRTFYRLRLSLAHELGHLVMHRKMDDARLQKKADLARIESQAYHFAASFIAPRNEYLADVVTPSIERMLALKSTWGLSVQAQTSHLKTLGMIDVSEAGRIWRSIGRRGWRTVEPGDDRAIEDPVLLRRSVDLIFSESTIPNSDFLRKIPIGLRPIACFTGMSLSELRAAGPMPCLDAGSNIVSFPG